MLQGYLQQHFHILQHRRLVDLQLENLPLGLDSNADLPSPSQPFPFVGNDLGSVERLPELEVEVVTVVQHLFDVLNFPHGGHKQSIAGSLGELLIVESDRFVDEELALEGDHVVE